MSKISKANQLRDKSIDELKKERLDLQRSLFNLRMQKATGQLTKSHLFQESKKEIARINIVLNEKNRMGN